MDIKKTTPNPAATAAKPTSAAASSSDASASRRAEVERAMEAVSPQRVADFLSTNRITKGAFGALVNVMKQFPEFADKPPEKK